MITTLSIIITISSSISSSSSSSSTSSSSISSSNSSSIWNIVTIRMHATHLAQNQGVCLTLSRFECLSTWPNTVECTMFSRGSYFLNRFEFL